MRIVVAMSGGVDSTTVAALLVRQGYECIGVTMKTYARDPSRRITHGCCTIEEVRDAQMAAHELGIPHYLVNYEGVFEDHIIGNFLDEYVAGRTPNPCVRCNQFVKFDVLREFARKMGAEAVASGHYARIVHDSRYRLFKGKDARKDQSYVLYPLTQEQLSHTLFPLGDYTKAEVREKARELGLRIHSKGESYEVCFVPDGDYEAFIRTRRPEAARPGPIRHVDGRILGEHQGVAFYTVGQRKGLGLAWPVPLYVVRIEGSTATLWVGEAEHLLRTRFLATAPNWIAFDGLQQPLECSARIRYNSPEAPAIVTPLDENTVSVELRTPQRAIAPGQAVVFYEEDEVLGGATIGQVVESPAGDPAGAVKAR